MRKKYFNYTPEKKILIHLTIPGQTGVGLRLECDKYKLQQQIFYPWQQQYFKNELAVFTRDKYSTGKEPDKKRTGLAPKYPEVCLVAPTPQNASRAMRCLLPAYGGDGVGTRPRSDRCWAYEYERPICTDHVHRDVAADCVRHVGEPT